MLKQQQFAYLTQGKLFTAAADAPRGTPVDSPFVQSIHDRREIERERRGYRAQGMMWNLTSASAGMDAVSGGDVRVPPRFTAVATGPAPGSLYYAILTDAVGGLFVFNLPENDERRLLHRQQLELRDLCRHPVSGDLACAVRSPDGMSHIGRMTGEGSQLRTVTSGDCVDECPCWSLTEDQTLVFHTAGVERQENGMALGLAPASITKLDLVAGKLTVLIEQAGFDCLAPRALPEGGLLYIRRPYQLHQATSPLRLAGDVLLFPFRLARAVVHFLDAFSRLFSKKPLITAGGPQQTGPDLRMIQLHGRWVQVQRDMARGTALSDKPLVPSDWVLIRRELDGRETTLAKHVVAYDVAADGRVLYSNGSGVFSLSGEQSTRLARARFIERVAWIV